MGIFRTVAAAAALLACATGAQAALIYTTSQYGGQIDAFHLNQTSMSSMRGLLTATNSLTTGTDFANAATLSAYDALWVNDRYGVNGAASAAEVNAIRDFVSSGKRAVFITDNSGWAAWNNSIEAITGGQITDTCASSNGTALVANELTDGVGTLYSSSCNSLLQSGAGLEMLFSNNMAGLFSIGSGQALVLTSVDIVTNGGLGNNAQFAQNIADWLGEVPVSNSVPTPSSLALAVLGLLAIPAFRRRRA